MSEKRSAKSIASDVGDPWGCLRNQAQPCFQALLYKDQQGYLGEFIQGLIHNINGPLQNMSMLAELITAGQQRANDFAMRHLSEHQGEWKLLHEKQNQRLGQVSDQIGTFVEMLRDIIYVLELERTEGGLDVNQVITRLMQILRADLFFKHQVATEMRLASGLPLVSVPAGMLILAMVHLFRNAMIAMRESKDKHLIVETCWREPQVWFVFRDSGCGFTPAQTDRLFEPHYSGWGIDQSKPDKHHKHLGLGLFTVRTALLPYGAAVTLERQDRETVACLRLPTLQRHA
jgi:signal transduction histidine kinase